MNVHADANYLMVCKKANGLTPPFHRRREKGRGRVYVLLRAPRHLVTDPSRLIHQHNETIKTNLSEYFGAMKGCVDDAASPILAILFSKIENMII